MSSCGDGDCWYCHAQVPVHALRNMTSAITRSRRSSDYQDRRTRNAHSLAACLMAVSPESEGRKEECTNWKATEHESSP